MDLLSGIVNTASARVRSWRWAPSWRWIILIGAGSTALLAVMDASGPLRAVTTIGFLLVCPGMSIVRLLDLGDALAETTLAIATSVALAGLVAGTLLYFGLWSPPIGLAMLILIALDGLVVDLLRERGAVRVVRGLVLRAVGRALAGASAHRSPTGADEPHQPARPTASRPARATVRERRAKRLPLGSDPFDTSHPRDAVANSIERAIGELARRRDDPPR